MRTAFITQLIEEARLNPDIFLVVGDLGFSVVESFQKEFPDRFLNVGVAEQNMTGIAAGLAMEGYKVFTYSIANFPTLRCMEQIRYDICYHELDVTIVAVGGGYSYGPLGASHHATEDLGMLRTIPNITVCAPGDPVETKLLTSLICQYKGPCYLRLGKAGEPEVHKSLGPINWGEIINVRNGTSTAVLSTGAMLKYASDFIEDKNLNWGLFSVPFVKPLDTRTLEEIASRYEKVITIEEHQSSGGFGSAILEALNGLRNNNRIKNIPQLKVVAIPDSFISVAGTQTLLRQKMHLEIQL